MEDIQKLKNELDRYKKEVKRLEKSLESAKYWNDENNLNELTIRATNQSIEIDELKRKLKMAEHFNSLNNVKEVSLRATQRGNIIEKQNKEIEELKNEIQKLKNENKTLKSKGKNIAVVVHNERGAGRKARFSDQEKEMMRMYRIQGKKLREIAEMYNCSVGLIHKIINE
ncbi:hypothetical protein NSA50_17020 [Clostridium sp. DSM 100503]|uniref:hypothetical protein n=1 Tax=Clostridium sp. DSM 100503 TaxID=2963282 RepID=UPI002149DF0D|nr:hypothetical protein [Clostridium sp. DSM 100503]MCR1952728.1 hypothetical protein [Clostridium sp. DSM 100503]